MFALSTYEAHRRENYMLVVLAAQRVYGVGERLPVGPNASAAGAGRLEADRSEADKMG